MKISKVLKKTGVGLGAVIILIILLLAIMISSICLWYHIWLYNACGYIYKDVYSEKSPDGEYRINIQTTSISEGISHNSYLCKITLINQGRGRMLVEYEGGSRADLTPEDVIEVKWDSEEQRVTVILQGYEDKKQEIALDYSMKNSAVWKNSYGDIWSTTKGMLISGLILIVSVLFAEIFISILYRNHCYDKLEKALNSTKSEPSPVSDDKKEE